MRDIIDLVSCAPPYKLNRRRRSIVIDWLTDVLLIGDGAADCRSVVVQGVN